MKFPHTRDVHEGRTYTTIVVSVIALSLLKAMFTHSTGYCMTATARGAQYDSLLLRSVRAASLRYRNRDARTVLLRE